MVKVYAVALAVGVVGLLIVVLGGVLAVNRGRAEADPGERAGMAGKSVVGGLFGFGMGGMSAEFAPIDLVWPVALAIALVAAGLAVFWVRFVTRHLEA